MYSLIIKNCRLIDGSGNAEQSCDIAIEGDKIVAIAPRINSAATSVIDAKNKVVCPGFVDIQNHSDSYWQLFDNPGLDSVLAQGYTTILVGQCGASLAPLLSAEAILALQKWHSTEGYNINWQNFAEFAAAMSERSFGCNVASLVGYSTLRRGIVGDATRALSPEENDIIKTALSLALESGSFGMSTGLAYGHELQTSELELYDLAKLLKAKNGLLSVHLRSETEQVTESLREALDIARHSDVNLKISHLKIRNQQNWRKIDEVIEELELAWHQGLHVNFDVYPYATIWQVLYSYLPAWSIQGGRSHILGELSDPVQRNKILTALNNSSSTLRDLLITSTSAKLSVIGKTIAKLAKDMEISSEQAVLKLVENGGSEVLVFDENLNYRHVAELSRHPLGFIATDGGGFSPKISDRLVHPRCFGTAPKFLKEVREDKQITLQEAIRKLTSGPAKKIGLEKRGLVAVGFYADLVIFDDAEIKDNATLTNPYQFNSGIDQVLVNGVVVASNNNPNGTLKGRFLKKK